MTTPSPIRDVLRLDEVPPPTIGSDDKNKVLISTHYAGIQYPDVSTELSLLFLCMFIMTDKNLHSLLLL